MPHPCSPQMTSLGQGRTERVHPYILTEVRNVLNLYSVMRERGGGVVHGSNNEREKESTNELWLWLL